METITSCNTASIDPFIPTLENPWDSKKANHVYRRLAFGASQSQIDAALNLSPEAFIDQMVDTAFALPPTTAPVWADWVVSDFSDFENENDQFIIDWYLQTGNDIFNNQLRDRLSFFWMNHFVTQLETYFYAPFLYKYYHINQSYALGNFKEFVREIGISSAMLIFLNGWENTADNPNENYARELYELFTLGLDNGYDQFDITETAKALTGYNHWLEEGSDIYFDESTFNNSIKTIFGQEGNWGYDDVIDILFEQRATQIATHICRKLYRFFVSQDITDFVENNIISVLASTFISTNFELVPVLKQLFKSEHFFNEEAQGVIIKSPFDFIYNFIKETDLSFNEEILDAIIYFTDTLGQNIFEPPDVAGWQRDQEWINTSTLPGRWLSLEYYIYNEYLNNPEGLRTLAKNLSNNSIDPYYITQVITNKIMAKEFYTPEDYDIATDVFKGEIPQNYYDQGLWNLDWETAPGQIATLLIHLAKAPELQLK